MKLSMTGNVRVEAIAEGRVHGVGYRSTVADAAKICNIKGTVKNLQDGRVEIIAEGNHKKMAKFIEDVKIKNPRIFVDGFVVNYTKVIGNFKGFDVVF